MTYCYQCGSEVIEDDAFCPYCGVSLQEVESEIDTRAEISSNGEAGKPRNENFSSPENLQAAPSKDFSRGEKFIVNPWTKPDDKKASEIDNGVVNKVENIESEIETENKIENKIDAENQQTEFSAAFENNEKNVSRETAAARRNTNGTDDDFLISGVDAQNSDALETDLRKSADADADGNPLGAQEDLLPLVVAPDDNQILSEASASNQTESTLQSYEESEVLEGADVERLNESTMTALSGTLENETNGQENVKPLPFIPPAIADENKDAKNNEKEAQSADAETYFQMEITENESPRDENKNRQNENFQNENQQSENPQPIEKPATGLENPEVQSMKPRFDSVRILETPKKEENAAGGSFGFSEISESEARNQREIENTISENVPTPKAGSYTMPNIGGSTDGKKSAKLKPLDEGTVLNDRYEIVRKIGGGGMGAVYLASDKNLGGVLRAIKEMVQSYIEDEQQEKAIADFKRESTLLTSLEHQSIPTIYDYFFDEREARFYLVMKYISGGDLASRLRAAPEGRIDERTVTEWAIQIADVLDYLHNRQPPIVYRDLKPANIMTDGNSGRAMLIDFGIARWINKEEKGVTAVGTMGYAPPELFSGNVEPRSDIYSLGSTMFHLLTGADPQSNPLLIFDFEKHPRPRQINPQLSDQIEKILMRAVEYNADKRFKTAGELRETLEKHLEKLQSGQMTYGVREVPAAISLSEQTVFCGFCGRKIVASDLFCAFCGAKQPLAKQGVHSDNYRPSAQNITAQLLIVGTGELETPAFTIEKDESLLGRRDPMSNIFPEVDLSRFDPQAKISRRHARIRRSGDCFVVEDLGSSNGTMVESSVKEKIRLQPRQPYTLTNGDKLKLGDTTLHFIIA
ncbi:MAG: protein kinase [Acidobacteria bacterium]|nr:protein kinase [Acidobacteriota bacterium]